MQKKNQSRTENQQKQSKIKNCEVARLKQDATTTEAKHVFQLALITY